MNETSLVTKEVVNDASLVTYCLVLINHLITLIEIITEPTLLVDTKMTLMMEEYIFKWKTQGIVPT